MEKGQDSVAELVRKAENNYVNGSTQISEFVDFSQYDTINRIEAYLNSRHTSGDVDSMGREKPFFNIVTAATNIWYRATDIDRKNIRIKSTKRSNIFAAFVATIHLQEWMKRAAFGTFLNDWGRSLARYGSTVVKFVEQDGDLKASVIPWNRMIVDAVDFDNNVRIEKLDMTPAQLRKNSNYDQDMVEGLLESLSAREDLNRTKKDNKSEYITVYEVHGELPLSYLTDDEKDEKTYRQQMHIVSFVGKGKKDYDDFTLFKGKEAKDPYMITHLIEEEGRTLGIGAVEHLFDAQWMKNHNVKQIKDQLDLASKLIFQTSDSTYVGRNVLSSVETGDIMVYKKDEPLTQIANNSHDISALQNFGIEWQNQAKEITSTPDSISGDTMPSGTAYRQVAILNQESHSLFEIMTENKGLAIEEMMRKYILPFLKKKMDTAEEITATLDAQGITEFDSMYVPSEAIKFKNRQTKKDILSGRLVGNMEMSNIENMIRSGLTQQGNTRSIKPSDIPSKTWKEFFKDLEWEVEVEVTNEQSNKEVILTTLTTVLQTIAANPLVLQDPNFKMLFGKILETTGAVSAIEIAQMGSQQPSNVPSVETKPKPRPNELTVANSNNLQ